MLVVGSGASGLAAAVVRRARRRARRAGDEGRAPSCNSAKAQGGIQAAFGDDDSPEQHAEDVWQQLARDGRPRAGRGADRRGAGRDPLARGARRRVHARERRLPAGALRRRDRASGCCRSATAPATRSRPRCARRSRRPTARRFPNTPARRARAGRNGWRATLRAKDGERSTIEAGAVVLAAGGRCFAEARGARRALDQPPRRDRRGDADRASSSAPRRATSTRSSTTRTAAPGRRRCRATRSPRRRAPTAPAAERRGRGVHRRARPARRRRRGDRSRGRGGPRRRRRRTAGRRCCSTRRAIPEADAEISLPYMLRRYRAAGIDPLAEPILTYPVLHYQNGGLVIDDARRDDARGPLRVRRDRGRHARPQPDDGQLAARVHACSAAAPGRGGGRESERHEHDRRRPTCSRPSRTPPRTSTSGR